MSNKRKTTRAKGEGKLGIPSGTAAYIDKVQYYKSVCAQVGYPWEDATALFDEACKVWLLPLPAIVDKLAEEVREAHVKWPGRLLEFKGTLLVVKESDDPEPGN